MRNVPPEEVAARLRAIFDAANFAIITIDDRGIIEDVNPAMELMFGYSSDELIGRNVRVLMSEPDRTAHDGYMDHYMATGERKIIGIGRKVAAARKDGSEFPIHLSVSEVQLPGRRFFTGIIEDLSLRVEAEQRASELQEELTHLARVSAMGELASALAHELSQPLTAISNYTSTGLRLLNSDNVNNLSAAGELCAKASREAVRAGDIIRSLRRFIETGENERAPHDIRTAINEAAHLTLAAAHAHDISFSIKSDPKLPKVWIDRIQMQQVFHNLIKNSVDSMRDQTRAKKLAINILKRDDGSIEIVCDDTGHGVPQELKDRLFLPFVTTKKNGMGVGLAISRKIIETHGGSIFAEDAPGGGARFRITLPTQEA